MTEGPRARCEKPESRAFEAFPRSLDVARAWLCPAARPHAHRGRRALGEVILLISPDFRAYRRVSIEPPAGKTVELFDAGAFECEPTWWLGTGDALGTRGGILTGIDPEKANDWLTGPW